MASRAGQKGTIGILVPQSDMPFTRGGIVPDIIINPHAIPSRMTLGQLVEMLFGKALLNIGGFGDCTPFVNKGPKHDTYGDILENYGYNRGGTEILYNGFTGEQLESEIYMGPTYYMRLKHMVKDKINHRARGPMQMLTRQTVQGRANDGGLRIGEMERDGVIGHGATAFLKESFIVRGDEYKMAICNNSGTIAVYNVANNQFYSLYSDGYIKFNDTEIMEDMKLESFTRFGRSFSIVNVPYSLKLLIQELQTMNIQMRLITEDNINHNMSLTSSLNLQNLLKEDVNNFKIYKERLSEKLSKDHNIKTNLNKGLMNMQLNTDAFDENNIENKIQANDDFGFFERGYTPQPVDSPAYVPISLNSNSQSDEGDDTYESNNDVPYAPAQGPPVNNDVSVVSMNDLQSQIDKNNNKSILEPVELDLSSNSVMNETEFKETNANITINNDEPKSMNNISNNIQEIPDNGFTIKKV